MDVETNVLALQNFEVEAEALGLCFSMHSTTSTTNSWPSLKTG